MKTPIDRRLFLTGAAGLALAGCDRFAGTSAGQDAFKASESLTYAAQSRLRQGKLAREFSASDISKYFKPNGSIDPKDPVYKKLVAAKFADFSMAVGGLVGKPRSFTLSELKALPPRTQITRHDCVEGWSSIGQWTGVPLHEILSLVEPKANVRYVVFHCFDRYDTDYTTEVVDQQGPPDPSTPTFYGSIGMADALHPQTLLAYEMNGETLPVAHGAPLRLRVERLLGYKNTKYIKSIELVESFKDMGDGNGGYWEDQGYNWYGGI